MKLKMMWAREYKSLNEDIDKACEYFETKYGVKPDSCLVHISEYSEDVKREGVKVTPVNKNTLKKHIWIECNE